MNENIQFLQAFLKNPAKVGAIIPSSPELAKKMLDDISPDQDNIIIELGTGTGAVTRFIPELVPDDRSYIGIELDTRLVRTLRRSFPSLKIIRGSAEDIAAIHEKTGFGNAKYILSCLPFVSLPNEIVDSILKEIEKYMDKGCLFRTFQYAHGFYLPPALKLRKFMRERYGCSVKSKLVLKNVPPAYTLTWSTLDISDSDKNNA